MSAVATNTKVFNPRTGLRDLVAGEPKAFDDGSWTVRSASLADYAQESTADFLAAIHGEDGFMELRAIASRKGERVYRQFVELPLTPERMAEVQAFAREHGATHNIYHAVAPRRMISGGGLDNCAALRALFVEIDLKDGRRILDAWNAIHAFPLKPTAIVHSGGGLHVYWLLCEPIDLGTDPGVLRRRGRPRPRRG